MSLPISIPLLLAATAVLAEIDMNFIKYPESVTAPVGDSVTFECEVDVPAEKLIWRTRPVDGPEGIWEKVVTGKEKSTEVSSRLAVEVKDNTQTAFYQCVVLYGSVILVSVPAKLSVASLDLSKNSLEKRVITAPLHNTVVLHCKQPLSDPPADLTWWKESTKGSKKPIETPHGVLVIHNTSLSDSGTYGCKATNKLSLKAADLPEKTVLKIQRDDTGEVRFVESEDYVGVKDNDVLTMPVKPRGTLRLYCGAVGVPPPKITWTREGRTPLPKRHDHAILNIANFTAADEGIYSCSANGIRRSWKVVVLQPPRWEGVAANANDTEGKGVSISCGNAVGYPQPEVYWVLNGERVSTGTGVTATDSDLNIEHLEKKHAGIVQCFACNKLGCSFLAAMLTVVPLQISDQDYSMETPKTLQSSSQLPKRHNRKNSRKQKVVPVMVPPSRPNVTRLSDQSVMLSWTQPREGLPILFFKVQYKEATNTSKEWNTLTQEIPPHIHSYEVDGLTPDKYYRFRIAAVYSNQDNNQGRSSTRFFLQSGEYKGPSAPVLTKVEATSPHSLQSDWTWSRGDGAETEGFYLCVRAVSSAGAYECVRAPASARSLELHHFSPDTQYELKLRAYTLQAPSEFSAIKVAKTQKLSNAPTSTSPAPVSEAGATGAGGAGGAGVALGAALGAGGVLVAALFAALMCRRARRLPKHKENASSLEGGGANAYIPAKVPITITSNPMHSEGSDPGVEMSFLHNNNTGNNDDTLTHSRKNGPAPRQYV
ncbi:interference hedgehog isoform X1 [Bombyx mori]|uniref:Interference hedgehog-like n=2 Tax=Bombyx mori TaxID=7091 RepID=A0A8R2M2M7_BOMMO|nr:interference hedgehog isoform X1 [Bombyx mori]